MALRSARGQITIVDLNDGKTINLYLSVTGGARLLNHNTWNDTYTPNYSTSEPLVITPILSVGGKTGNMCLLENDNVITKIEWSINGHIITARENPSNPSLVDSSHLDPLFKVCKRLEDPNKLDRYLVMKDNMQSSNYTIECKITYYDSSSLSTIQVYAGTDLMLYEAASNLFQSWLLPSRDQDGDGNITNEGNPVAWKIWVLDGKESLDYSDVFIKWSYLDGGTNTWIPITLPVMGTNEAPQKKTLSNGLLVWEIKVREDNEYSLDIFGNSLKFSDVFSILPEDPMSLVIEPNAIEAVLLIRADVIAHPGEETEKTDFDIVSVKDLSDPYQLNVISNTGDKITNSVQSTTITAILSRNGERILDVSQIIFDWDAFDSMGNPWPEYKSNGLLWLTDPEFGEGYWLWTDNQGQTVTRKTGGAGVDSHVITKEMIQYRATFVCTAYLP